MSRVDGKVAIVSGAARGLGEAMCVRLAEQGARVVVTDIDESGAEKVADNIGENAFGMKLDVSSEEQWATVIDATMERFGKVNVVVNNAGLIQLATVEDETADGFRRVMSVMCDGVFFGMKHGIRGIKAANEPGSIVNLSSIVAESGYSPYFAYSAAKGAVRSMTRSAAIHLQERSLPIRVNTILPGALGNNDGSHAMGADLLGMVDAFVQRNGYPPALSAPKGPGTEPFYPNGQPEDAKIGPGMGTSDDAAFLVVYLASDESKFINGTEIRVDNCASIQPV
jgi:3(or 17)beta-hydroxysteroid dehydrogenase